MRNLLLALALTIIVVPTIRADSVTYVATEQITSSTPTQENISWAFTGRQDFSLLDTLVPAPAYRLDPSEKPGDWLYLFATTEKLISGGPSPVGFPALTFGTWGTFGHIEKRCWPDCFTGTDKFSLTFTDLPQFGFQLTDRTSIGTYPVGSGDPPPVSSTPEPGSLVLFGSGMIGLISLRKLYRPEKL